jgi:hypothetical protein
MGYRATRPDSLNEHGVTSVSITPGRCRRPGRAGLAENGENSVQAAIFWTASPPFSGFTVQKKGQAID